MTYEVKINRAYKELSARESIMFKDTSNALKLDEIVQEGKELIISPEGYVELSVYNEKSEDKNYQQYIIIDREGRKYFTGSENFFNSFMEIYTEMAKTEEEYQISIYKKPSSNYKGKFFLTCSLI